MAAGCPRGPDLSHASVQRHAGSPRITGSSTNVLSQVFCGVQSSVVGNDVVAGVAIRLRSIPRQLHIVHPQPGLFLLGSQRVVGPRCVARIELAGSPNRTNRVVVFGRLPGIASGDRSGVVDGNQQCAGFRRL